VLALKRHTTGSKPFNRLNLFNNDPPPGLNIYPASGGIFI